MPRCPLSRCWFGGLDARLESVQPEFRTAWKGWNILSAGQSVQSTCSPGRGASHTSAPCWNIIMAGQVVSSSSGRTGSRDPPLTPQEVLSVCLGPLDSLTSLICGWICPVRICFELCSISSKGLKSISCSCYVLKPWLFFFRILLFFLNSWCKY